MNQLNVVVLLFFSFGTMACLGQNTYKTAAEGGMLFKWKVEGKSLKCQLSAPTDGWLALGLNPSRGLTGTYLIMANITANRPYIEDHFILKPGDHRKVETLGEKQITYAWEGEEKDGMTELQFILPLDSRSSLFPNIRMGNKIYVLLAYSQSDDFDHHSIFRTEISIHL